MHTRINANHILVLNIFYFIYYIEPRKIRADSVRSFEPRSITLAPIVLIRNHRIKWNYSIWIQPGMMVSFENFFIFLGCGPEHCLWHQCQRIYYSVLFLIVTVFVLLCSFCGFFVLFLCLFFTVFLVLFLFFGNLPWKGGPKPVSHWKDKPVSLPGVEIASH